MHILFKFIFNFLEADSTHKLDAELKGYIQKSIAEGIEKGIEKGIENISKKIKPNEKLDDSGSFSIPNRGKCKT